jgi:hypothetical protein
VTRQEWGARPRRDRTVLPAERVRFLVLHYSAMDADEQARHSRCAARVRGIQNFHMDGRGWSDIAYTWVVCRHGYVFQGRGWRVRTAATGDANDYTVAACFLGNDSAGRDDVTNAGRQAFKGVLAFVIRNAPNLEGVRGHRDFMNTPCPGAELYRFANELERRHGFSGQ